MMTWVLMHPDVTPEHLGLLPGMLDASDPRPAREQFDANYQHGGGWRPQSGFVLHEGSGTLTYPGDPPFHMLAYTFLRDEMIVFCEYSYVAIIQKDHTFEVCRMD